MNTEHPRRSRSPRSVPLWSGYGAPQRLSRGHLGPDYRFHRWQGFDKTAHYGRQAVGGQDEAIRSGGVLRRSASLLFLPFSRLLLPLPLSISPRRPSDFCFLPSISQRRLYEPNAASAPPYKHFLQVRPIFYPVFDFHSPEHPVPSTETSSPHWISSSPASIILSWATSDPRNARSELRQSFSVHCGPCRLHLPLYVAAPPTSVGIPSAHGGFGE